MFQFNHIPFLIVLIVFAHFYLILIPPDVMSFLLSPVPAAMAFSQQPSGIVNNSTNTTTIMVQKLQLCGNKD